MIDREISLLIKSFRAEPDNSDIAFQIAKKVARLEGPDLGSDYIPLDISHCESEKIREAVETAEKFMANYKPQPFMERQKYFIESLRFHGADRRTACEITSKIDFDRSKEFDEDEKYDVQSHSKLIFFFYQKFFEVFEDRRLTVDYLEKADFFKGIE